MDAKHPNIARLYDVFQDKKNFYVVQEYLPGDDLYVTLGERIFTEDEAIQIIKQTLMALKYFHDRNIVHRDIKSDNLILIQDEMIPGKLQIKITDFSLASKIDPVEGGLKGFAGTPEYMAPEVVL